MINIVGLAGSGKSTQGQLLAKKLDCEWLSIGDILRAHLVGPARQEMLEGKIINDEITLSELDKALRVLEADKYELILDGCPRSLKQAEWLASKSQNGEVMLTAVVHLKAHKEVAKERLIHRGRQDDTEEAILQRFNDYKNTILPILDYLKTQDIPIIEIDADGTIDEVEKRVDGAFGIR